MAKNELEGKRHEGKPLTQLLTQLQAAAIRKDIETGQSLVQEAFSRMEIQGSPLFSEFRKLASDLGIIKDRSISDASSQTRPDNEKQETRKFQRAVRIRMHYGSMIYGCITARAPDHVRDFLDKNPKTERKLKEMIKEIRIDTKKKEIRELLKPIIKRLNKEKIPMEFGELLMQILSARGKLSREWWYKKRKMADPDSDDQPMDLDDMAPPPEDLDESA